MATETDSIIADAINDFRDSYIEKTDDIISQLSSLNQTMTELSETLSSIDTTQSDFYDRASDITKGIYFNTANLDPQSLSRAVLMSSLDEGQIDGLRDEIENPTPLPGDQ